MSGVGKKAMVAVFVLLLLLLSMMFVGAIGEKESPKAQGEQCVVTASDKKEGDSEGTPGEDTDTSQIPNNWGPLVEDAAEEAGLPLSVVSAQFDQESKWDPKAVSSVGAGGLGQFMPETWEMYGEGGDRFDPEDSIAAYGRYMAALKGEVEAIADGDANELVRLTLAAYNAGPGAVQKYDGVPPYPETQNYIEKILSKGQENFSTDCKTPVGAKSWDGDLGDGEWTTPLPGGAFTSGYGPRNVAGLPDWAQNHVGVDIATPGAGSGPGKTVVAPTDMRVVHFNDPDGCVIAKGTGSGGTPKFGYAFCHLNDYAVKKNDTLKRGDIIGTEGNRAGLGAIATHLHFEMYKPEAPDVVFPYQGHNIDPTPILKEKGAWPE